MHVLFGRVSELILSPSVVALFDATVVPQVLDGLDVGTLECGHCFKVHCPDQVGLFLQQHRHEVSNPHPSLPSNPYLRVWLLILNCQEIHGPNHALHGHKYVLKDEFDEAALVLVGVACAVDDAHLLDERRLAGLSGAYKNECV